MSRSLNLTAERGGPSVWERPTPAAPWGLAAVALGAAMLSLAWRRPRNAWLMSAGMSSLALGVLSSIPANDILMRARARRSAVAADPLDEALRETFPASDTPAASTPTRVQATRVRP